MANNEEQRTIIFYYPNEKFFPHHTKHVWMSDKSWKRFLWAKFDANDRNYTYINEHTILVECGKAL